VKLVRGLGRFCLERLSRIPRVGLIVLRIWRRGQSSLPSCPQSDGIRELWDGADNRLSSLGYEAGSRILSLLLLRNTQASGTKVCISLASQPAPWLSSVILSSRDQTYQADIQEPKREHRLIPALQFVHTQVYKYIFGKPADGLERSVEGEDECESSSIVSPFTQSRDVISVDPEFDTKRFQKAETDEVDMLTLNQPPLTQHISIPKDMSQLSVEAYTAGLVEGVMDGLGLVSHSLSNR
jgi:hypothetical protein